MRIGVDGRYIQDHFPGIGRYTFNLVRALVSLISEDTVVLLYDPAAPNSYHDFASLDLRHAEVVPARIPTMSVHEHWQLPALVRRLGLDVLHSPYYVKPYLLPVPAVVTVHDTIPSRYPEYIPSVRGRWVYRLTVTVAVATARRVVSDSDAACADLVHYFPTARGKVRVVYAGVAGFEPAEAPRVLAATGRPFLLFVGINKPHKNLVGLVDAYATSGIAADLVIAGPDDPRFPEARKRAEELNLGAQVHWLGPVSEADLRRLYQTASLLVFPTLAEGFGLPALEAMASGLPVVASDIPVMQEVVGDAGMLVPPRDVEALAAAMKRLTEDTSLWNDLQARGLARARRFTWEEAARQALAVYREAAA